MRIKCFIILAMLSFVFGIAGAGLWDPPILNPSFESVENGTAHDQLTTTWGYNIDDWFENESPDYYSNYWEFGSAISITSDGDLWAGTETGGAFYQAIGNYDGSEAYTITALLGDRPDFPFITAKFSLYAGGSETDASDGVQLESLATLLDSVEVTLSDGILVSSNVYEVTLRLESSGAQTGDLIWIEVASVEGKNYYDNIRIEVTPTAYNPDPADEEADVALDKVLSWSPGRDPNDLSQTLSTITGHYVFFGDDEYLVTAGDSSVYRGYQALGDEDYNPADDGITLVIDEEYFWRIDESINGSPVTDANTVEGIVWSFKTIRTIPDILVEPEDITAMEGMDVFFSMDVYNPITGDSTGLTYEWKKVGDPTVLSTEPTLELIAITDNDEGEYYCTVTNSNGSRDSEAAVLSVTKKVVLWQFNDGAGSVATDSSGNGINGTVNSECIWLVDGGRSGQAGDSAIHLPGDPNAIVKALNVDLTTKPVDNIFMGTSSWSINVWLNFPLGYGISMIGGFGDCNFTADSGFSDRYYNTWDGTVEFNFGEDGFWWTEYTTNTWQMWTMTYDSETEIISYYRGTELISFKKVTLIDVTENAFKLGPVGAVVWADSTTPVNAKIDDFCVFDGALTPLDIQVLYQGFYCTVEPATDLNHNCVVDVGDLVEVLSSWMDCNWVPVELCQ